MALIQAEDSKTTTLGGTGVPDLAFIQVNAHKGLESIVGPVMISVRFLDIELVPHGDVLSGTSSTPKKRMLIVTESTILAVPLSVT